MCSLSNSFQFILKIWFRKRQPSLTRSWQRELSNKHNVCVLLTPVYKGFSSGCGVASKSQPRCRLKCFVNSRLFHYIPKQSSQIGPMPNRSIISIRVGVVFWRSCSTGSWNCFKCPVHNSAFAPVLVFTCFRSVGIADVMFRWHGMVLISSHA